MGKLYSEKQLRELGKWVRGKNVDEFIASLTPIQLPTDDEIKEQVDSYHGLESYKITFVQGAKWMRDKIKGGNNE